MHFKITARTLLQLGAELISSDAIAFYELIKNAFDAGSRKVEVRVVLRLPQELVYRALTALAPNTCPALTPDARTQLLQQLQANLDAEAPEVSELRQVLVDSLPDAQLLYWLKKANFILIKDRGEGMSLADVEEIYLTIGTRNRRQQRGVENTGREPAASRRPILGEKGLGRLSVMRLGDGLLVETTRAGEARYNVLEIDWTIFSHDSDALLESITIAPRLGRSKEDPAAQGTSIRIYDLRAAWTKDKLEAIAREQLGRFIDPFGRTNRDFITLWFNKQPIILTGIDRTLFDYSHATVKATLAFGADDVPLLTGEIHYRVYDRRKTFLLTGTHIASVINSPNPLALLRSLGPFAVELYWYNRQLLTRSVAGIDAKYIKELIATWGGGLMVYRDGFRVNPYGGPDDDWLNLDVKALASGGYKLNRRQVVGKVDISSHGNPNLLDQTNREGLRDNAEKQALVSLLQYIIWKELKVFLDEVKEEEQANAAAQSLAEIEQRIYAGQHRARAALHYLVSTYPALQAETEVIATMEEVLAESEALFKSAKASADALEDRLHTTISLAGLGLMVDVIAHELNRATEYAITTINEMDNNGLPQQTASSMSTLRAQLKTLQTRLKVLDPLGPSGRQRKTLVDLRKLLADTLQYHQAQFERHHIQLTVRDSQPGQPWTLQAVPGMIVQVVENLLSNAVYWLKQEHLTNRLSFAEIIVTLDRARNMVSFTDNGPGVPVSKREDIFRAFVSTKPPGEGKGLGLYISREIAQYHGAALYLQAPTTPADTSLHTFVLDLQHTK